MDDAKKDEPENDEVETETADDAAGSSEANDQPDDAEPEDPAAVEDGPVDPATGDSVASEDGDASDSPAEPDDQPDEPPAEPVKKTAGRKKAKPVGQLLTINGKEIRINHDIREIARQELVDLAGVKGVEADEVTVTFVGADGSEGTLAAAAGITLRSIHGTEVTVKAID